jgi:L-lactate dehydrogenase (cytochrome)
MTIITCVEDLRVLARQRVPRMFFDYVDAGSWSESTYRANRDDFRSLDLRPRVAVGLGQRQVRSTMIGQPVAMPVGLAPTGLAGMLYPDGEIEAARAAAEFGVPFTLSTMSICSIEDVAAGSSAPFWFQLYLMKDRDFVAGLIERARLAGCPCLVLTLDLAVFGQRHRDIRNGLSVPPQWSVRTVWDFLSRPGWGLRMLGTRRRKFGNIVGHARNVVDMKSLSSWTMEQFDGSFSWRDVEWVRRQWPGKLVVKGILDPEDARIACDMGADAVIVSNHGGRQLDGTRSSIMALPDVVEAVGERVEVHLDSGVRCGQDVLRALARGARGVYIGRPFLYGLGAAGGAGVRKCLQLIHDELDLTMALCGLDDIQRVGPGILFR